MTVRHDVSQTEVLALLELPLFQRVDRARRGHVAHHAPDEIELCSLVNVKSGGCSEDCGYCSQSVRHPVAGRQPMLEVADVLQAAREAKANGSARLCMGAAWSGPRTDGSFEKLLTMIGEVKRIGIETCVTLGRLSREQAERLRAAGLDVYNHNLDTSREYYPKVVTTHGFEDRLETLRHVRAAGLRVCSGGIIGMGESLGDRASLLAELGALDPHPESVPINALVPIPGTPLGHLPRIDPLDVVRMVAAARIVLPRSRVRLSAGRKDLGREAELWCLYAGANSIFWGDRLLTTDNATPDSDRALLEAAGLRPRGPVL
jgi:biotin synthase